jgi:hypothetical protein
VSNANDAADAFRYAMMMSSRRQGKSYAMSMHNIDHALVDDLAKMTTELVARDGLQEWLIERRGLVYKCVVRKALGIISGGREFRYKIWVRIPEEHPLAKRYNMTRAEGARKRRTRVERAIQNMRPGVSTGITKSNFNAGLVVSLGSERDQVEAMLVAADVVDKLAEKT